MTFRPDLRPPWSAGPARTRRALVTAALFGSVCAALSAVAFSGAGLTGGASARGAPAAGGLVVTHEPAGPGYGDEAAYLRDRRLLERVADRVNERVALPTTVTVTARGCGSGEVSYDPDASRIDVCYEHVAETRDLFRGAGRTPEQAAEATEGVLTETLYHETAHALIDKLELPYVGREEDVADQFAAYVLVQQGEAGRRHLLWAADDYDLYAQRGGPADVDFSDEHPPDAARSANYRCYLYGADPGRFASLVDGRRLTRDRAGLCADEYRDLQRGWSRLLAPHRR
ncbi:DUF4344 domain-containing metallopeptidase [Streptomyces sp. URMC 123]|uniref:DUF4344 domain-containing metallopeptidase n=1 Tax=Streptomyces sp. URMC 123 TaxID=3423403 RepID=UPI003F1CF014